MRSCLEWRNCTLEDAVSYYCENPDAISSLAKLSDSKLPKTLRIAQLSTELTHKLRNEHESS